MSAACRAQLLILLLQLHQFATGAEPGQVRLLQGPYGKFAGDDFDCEEKDVFRNEPWARGACMIGCRSGPGSHIRPRCGKAVRVCEQLMHCAVVNVNVEGTVATLKKESELSRRTSKLKHISFTQNLHDRAPGRDANCAAAEPALQRRVGRQSCVLDCPKLNCTGGTALCYAMSECIAMDVGFGFAGRDAVARLRFALPSSPGPRSSVTPALN